MLRAEFRERLWLLLVMGMICLLLAAPVRPLAAHSGGTIQLSAAPAGEFELTVWTAPEPVRVGELHVIVGVAISGDGALLVDDALTIRVTAASGLSAPVTAVASREQSDNKFLYEAELILTDSAWYQVTVAVSHPDHDGGEVFFNIEALPAGAVNVSYAWLAAVPVAAVILWLFWRRRGAGTAVARPDSPIQ
jgi:hypothetical protein